MTIHTPPTSRPAASTVTSPRTEKRQRALWILGITALLIRLGYVLALRKSGLAWGDEVSYDQLAQNLTFGNGFCFVPGHPSVSRAPLYAFLLAGLYRTLGHRFLPVLVLQAVAGGLSAPLLARIGARASGSFPVGLTAGWLLAVNPLLVFTTGLLYTETFHVLLLLLLVLLWQRMLDEVGRRDRNGWIGPAVASGLLLGLNNLLKPNMLLFPLSLLAFSLLGSRNGRRVFLPVVCVSAAMLFVILPWAVRNRQVSGHWVLVSANAGVNLMQGNNSQVTDGTGLGLDEIRLTPGLSEVEQDQVFWRQGRQWIMTHPLGFIQRIPPKLGAMFSPAATTTRGHLMTRLAPLLNGVSLLYYGVALLGWLMTRRRWRDWLLLDLLILYPALLVIVFYGGTRYGIPAQPFITLYCAAGTLGLAARTGLWREQGKPGQTHSQPLTTSDG